MSEQKSSRTRTRNPRAQQSTDNNATTETQQEQLGCDECGGDIVNDNSTSERVCQDCGLVVDEVPIDHGPDWRSFSDSVRESNSRAGAPLTELRHDRGLNSEISWSDKDARGNMLSKEKRSQMRRLRIRDKRSKRTGGERGVSYANGEIQRMGSALGTPSSIQETAASIYRQAYKAGLIPGRAIEDVSSACLYIALRVHEEPRSLGEIATVSRAERKPISRTHLYLCRELNISLQPTNPSKYIPRFADPLNGDQELIRTAEQLVDEIDDHHFSGRDPTVLAAAALYAASIVTGELVTQRAVEDVSGVSDVSIRKTYSLFLVYADSVPLTSRDIDNTSSPLALSQLLNKNPGYDK